MNAERKKFWSEAKEIGILQKQLQTCKDIVEETKSKERDWEIQDKELDKLRSKVKNLEYSNNFKSLCIEQFERKFTSHSNTERTAAFRRKLKHAHNQRKI